VSEHTAAPERLRFHHVGVVVQDIDAQRQFYVESLGYTVRTEVIHDPLQGAFVQFLALPGADHYVELVAPDGPESKLVRASRRGLPLHHLCYATPAIEASLRSLAAAGALVFQEPVPAVAFGGRRIAWLANEAGLLIELVEQGAPGEL
jgi:methylmalonyl-CoA/ethylmalonyl-CoA epimerase